MPSVRTGTVPYWLDPPGRAYPPLDADEKVEVAVVGGRVTGLACARVLVAAGVRVRVSCTAVLVATDGCSDGVLPELSAAIRPARAQMLATAPLTERHFDAPVYAREGWDYWQQAPDGRLLIGGWRDAELEREFTPVDEPTPTLQARIEAFAGRLLGAPPSVTHRWAGLLGLTDDLRPLVGELRDGVWVSAGYSGHGNVLALACGELVANAILGKPAPELDLFSAGVGRART